MNVSLVFCLDDPVTLNYLVQKVGEACAAAGVLCVGEQVSDDKASHVYTVPEGAFRGTTIEQAFRTGYSRGFTAGKAVERHTYPLADVPKRSRGCAPAEGRHDYLADSHVCMCGDLLRDEAERIRASMLDLDPYSP